MVHQKKLRGGFWMNLAAIKDCKLYYHKNKVILTGIDKSTLKFVLISLSRQGFEEWINGIPIRYSLPEISIEDRNFLMKGTQLLVD